MRADRMVCFDAATASRLAALLVARPMAVAGGGGGGMDELEVALQVQLKVVEDRMVGRISGVQEILPECAQPIRPSPPTAHPRCLTGTRRFCSLAGAHIGHAHKAKAKAKKVEKKEEAARKSVVGGNSFGKIAAAVGGAAKWKALMEKTEPGRTVWIGGIPAWNHEAGLT